MRPVPELLDDELARLVRARLEARQPRRLPERFVPPARRSHRAARVAVAAAAAALILVLVLSGTQAARPELVPAVLSGLLHQKPAATPTPASPTPLPGRRPANGAAPAPTSAGGAPAGGTSAPAPSAPAAPGATPAAQPSTGGGPLPVPLPS